MNFDVDEDAIREEVEEWEEEIRVHEDWLTPSGKQRSAPMYEAFRRSLTPLMQAPDLCSLL